MGPGYPPDMMGPPAPPQPMANVGMRFAPQEQMAPPQPPMPQMGAPQGPMQAPGPDSLGGVVGQTQDPQSPMAQFQQAMQLSMRAFGPALRQPLPETSTPGLLQNILTFGMAGLYHNDYKNAYNRKVEEQNSAVQAMEAKQAFELVSDQQQIAALGGRQQMAMLNLQLRLLGLENATRNSQLQELHRAWQRQHGNTIPPITSETGQVGLNELGWEQKLEPGTGRVTLQPKAGGGGWADLPADSPLGQELGGGGGVPPGEAGSAAKPLPQSFGELRERNLDQRAQQSVDVARRKLQLTQKAAITPALERARRLKAAVEVAYSKSQGPLAAQTLGRGQRIWGGLTGTEPAYTELETISADFPGMIKALGGDSRISDADARAMADAVPKLGDTYNAAMNKVNLLLERLEFRRDNLPTEEELGGEITVAPPKGELGGAGGSRVRRLSSGAEIEEID